MGILSDLWDLSLGFTIGTIRLPDGRGVFYPWGISRLAYLVPSDEQYATIHRYMIFWGFVFFIIGLIAGPLAIQLLVVDSLMPGTEFTSYVVAMEAAICLLPLVIAYIGWAKKVTKDLPLFDGQGLDPTNAPSYEESVQRNLVWQSTFTLYACFFFSIAAFMVGVYSNITDPQNWQMWLVTIFFGVATVALPFAIRIKRKMPKQDFF
jgi:hypothetical protein